MNLSKNELLKMAINSKPKKEVLEKKSKNELIEYLFGVKVDECSRKKIAESERRLDKCNLTPTPLYRPGYFREPTLYKPAENTVYKTILEGREAPVYGNTADGSFDTQRTELVNSIESIRRWNEEEKPRFLDDTRKSVNNSVEIIRKWEEEEKPRFLDDTRKGVNNSFDIIRRWEEEEKPNALRLLDDSRKSIQEWIELQRPYFEGKMGQIERILLQWENVDKPNIVQTVAEIRDTRSVVQNLDMALIKSVQQQVVEYMQVEKPRIEAEYARVLTDFQQTTGLVEQVRNENIKLLELLGPLEQLRLTFGNAIRLQDFKSAIEQKVTNLELGLDQRKALTAGNEIAQVGEMSLRIDQNVQTIATMEGKMAAINSLINGLLDEWAKRFQNFQNTNRIRELADVGQLRLEFQKQVAQLEIGFQETVDNKVKSLASSQVSNYRDLRNDILAIQQIQSDLTVAIPPSQQVAAFQPAQNIQNVVGYAIEKLKTDEIVPITEGYSNMIEDQRRLKLTLVQIQTDIDALQRSNNDLIVATVGTTVDERIDDNLEAALQEMMGQKINDEIKSRSEQIKLMVREELNVAVPVAIQQVLDVRVQDAANRAVVAALADRATQDLASGVIRQTIQEIIVEVASRVVKQEVVKQQKDYVRATVVEILNSRSAQRALSTSPVTSRIREQQTQQNKAQRTLEATVRALEGRLTLLESATDYLPRKRRVPSNVVALSSTGTVAVRPTQQVAVRLPTIPRLAESFS